MKNSTFIGFRAARRGKRELRNGRRRVEQEWNKRFPPKITEHVDTWALERGIPVMTVLPRRTYHWQLPNTVEPTMSEQYSTRLIGIHLAQYLVPLSRARIVGSSAAVVLPDGSVASESVFFPKLVAEHVLPLPPPSERIQKLGIYYSLLNVWSRRNHYYHFLHDGILRLYGVEKDLPADVKYILPPGMSRWQYDALTAVGVKRDQIVRFNGSVAWELETLLFSNWVSQVGSHDKGADAWFRKKILTHFGVNPVKGTRRFFIDRSRMRNRKVVNQVEVLKYLEEFGFEAIAPETLSFPEQVKLFSQAEIIVGPHGSAFTNIYFAPENLILVDLVETSMHNLQYIFSSLSQSLGQSYWYLIADSVARPDGQLPDMKVPLEKLRATIEAIGLNKNPLRTRTI